MIVPVAEPVKVNSPMVVGVQVKVKVREPFLGSVPLGGLGAPQVALPPSIARVGVTLVIWPAWPRYCCW